MKNSDHDHTCVIALTSIPLQSSQRASPKVVEFHILPLPPVKYIQVVLARVWAKFHKYLPPLLTFARFVSFGK